MNRRVSRLSGPGLVLLILPLWLLSGCTTARQVGREAAGGAFDAARSWWAAEGRDAARDLAGTVTDAASAKLREEADRKRAEIEAKVQDGSATPLEMALWVLLGGLGAGGTKTVLERVLIGRRQAPLDPPSGL